MSKALARSGSISRISTRSLWTSVSDYGAPHGPGLLGDLPPDAENRHSISDFLNRKQPAVLAVLGAPGSGKTTLLRHTARRVFESKKRNVPILLYLRDHVANHRKPRCLVAGADSPGARLPR